VTRFVLDTTILSQVTKQAPLQPVLDWLDDRDQASLFVATYSLAEIERGILERAPGKGRAALETWFHGPKGPKHAFGGRILPFDEAAAAEWARLMSEGTAQGKPRSADDMIIAATASANGCIVVSLNDRHFRGAVPFVNPLSVS